jgi:hypothetical protein
MVIFLAIVGFIADPDPPDQQRPSATNPGLNGLILGVLLVGILLVLQPCDGGCFREVRWVNSFRAGSAEKSARARSAGADEGDAGRAHRWRSRPARCARSSIPSPRASTKRATSRATSPACSSSSACSAPSGACSARSPRSATRSRRSMPAAARRYEYVLDALKEGLAAPLGGMGTAFSSSLFGLSGSLILGFLDLQAGQAQNRFYTELENWLSSVTDVGSTSAPVDGGELAPPTSGAVRAILRNCRRPGRLQSSASRPAMASLADGISGPGQEHALRAADDARLGRGAAEEQKAAPHARQGLPSARRRRRAPGSASDMAHKAGGKWRGNRRAAAVDYWPGFVDALSTLLLAIMFLLSVFVLAQFFLSREISGKDEVLNRLNSQINELTQLAGAGKARQSRTLRIACQSAGFACPVGERPHAGCSSCSRGAGRLREPRRRASAR